MAAERKIKLLLTAGKALGQMTKAAGGAVGVWGRDVLAPNVSSFLQSMGTGPHGLSKEFFELLKEVGDARSKQEEERIMNREVRRIRDRLRDPDSMDPLRDKELLVRMVYCVMLGQEVDFGLVHALTMTQRNEVAAKKAGYLAASIMLTENSAFSMMLINSYRRDMESDNFLHICAALEAMAVLLSADTVPAVLQLVLGLMDHPREHVRKKAIIAFHSCWTASPASVSEELPNVVQRALCDRNPSVMISALPLVEDLASCDPIRHRDLVPALVAILKQIAERKLPGFYDFHSVPAPWAQCRLLRVLALLGRDHKSTSNEMYEVISDTIKRCDSGKSTALAVLYECIRTSCLIFPHPPLLDQCANGVAMFLSHDGNTMKHAGIEALSLLVRISSRFAATHQLTVVSCLEDPDESLQLKTLDLLHAMTTAKNVVSITKRMLSALRKSSDAHIKREMIQRIHSSAEQFAPNEEWYIHTMSAVLFFGGEAVPATVGDSVIEMLWKPEEGESDAEGHRMRCNLRLYAINHFLGVLKAARQKRDRPIPDGLVNVMAFVIGEYGNLSSDTSPELLLDLLVEMLEQQIAPATRVVVIQALIKIAGRTREALSTDSSRMIREILEEYRSSRSVDLQQLAYECLSLLDKPALLYYCTPLPGAAAELDLDVSALPHLSRYTSDALESGARPYIPKDERGFETGDADSHGEEPNYVDGRSGDGGLRFEAYPTPEPEYANTSSWVDDPMVAAKLSGNQTDHGSAQEAEFDSYSIQYSVPEAARGAGIEGRRGRGGSTRRRWGAHGFSSAGWQEDDASLQSDTSGSNDRIEADIADNYHNGTETAKYSSDDDHDSNQYIQDSGGHSSWVDPSEGGPDVENVEGLSLTAEEQRQRRAAEALFGDDSGRDVDVDYFADEELQGHLEKPAALQQQENLCTGEQTTLTSERFVFRQGHMETQDQETRAVAKELDGGHQTFEPGPDEPSLIDFGTVHVISGNEFLGEEGKPTSPQSNIEAVVSRPLPSLCLRPKDATVQEYGAAWKKHRGEAKTSISNDEIEGALSQEGNVDDGRPIPRKLCQLITNALAFHEVSHINDEGIFLAEEDAASDTTSMVLLHLRVLKTRVSITVRSADSNLSERVAEVVRECVRRGDITGTV